MKIGCKYTGPLFSPSGYGSANRGYVMSLDNVGIDVVTEIVSYDNNAINLFGEEGMRIQELQEKDISYDIKIIHTPCDSYIRHLEPCKYHIGHLFWETDSMSPEWVWNCNLMDEIWTGSEHNKRAFESSGVRVPIYIFPQAVDMESTEKKYKKWTIPGHRGFLFFSIFQWIERKNPEALVKAYFKEFRDEPDVGLLLKTYKENFSEQEKREIVADIWKWKREISSNAKVFVNVEKMDIDDVWRIYETGDCFVLPHRGEGWGRPIMESLMFKKPVIATNYGGVHDWLTKETYYPLTPKEVNVFGMEWAPHYRKNQKWADINIADLQKAMREVYEHQEKAKEVGTMGYEFSKRAFSYSAVGTMLKDRLGDIQKMINASKKGGTGSWLKN